MGQHVLAGDGVGEEHGIDVHIHVLQPLLVGHLVRRGVDADARIGVAEVQSAQLLDDLVHHALHVRLVGHVALDGDDLASGGLGDFRSRLDRRFIVEIHDGNVRAGLRKARRGAPADAPGAASDKALLAVQSHALNDSHTNASSN